MTSVLQAWVQELPMMQQTVLLTAVRGPDGLPKYHCTKYLLRWYRRCILFSALDNTVLTDPVDQRGGSFTGPSLEIFGGHRKWSEGMDTHMSNYLKTLDEVPHHFQLHFMHAAEIVGYKHPTPNIALWWLAQYERLVHDMHLWPETREQMDLRLGDSLIGWQYRADEATQS